MSTLRPKRSSMRLPMRRRIRTGGVPSTSRRPATGRRRWGERPSNIFKGRLPYHLRTSSTITRYERPTVVGADVVGDLTGRGLWTLTPRAGGTDVRFDWRVIADKPILRVLTPLLRPLFRWNHAWAIARAQEGLEPYCRRLGNRVSVN